MIGPFDRSGKKQVSRLRSPYVTVTSWPGAGASSAAGMDAASKQR
jgi:hypothetical protein